MIEDLNQGQQKFLDQYTRKELVGWCDQALRNGGTFSVPERGAEKNIYIEHALAKKWISFAGLNTDITGNQRVFKVLSTGWTTAASFLKR